MVQCQMPSDGCWFTADQHFGHANIITLCQRPFKDVEEMTTALIHRHNAVVGKNDVVWHLGDFSLNEKRVPEILPLLNGKHRLVAGNHDGCHTMRSKAASSKKKYLDWGFDLVEDEVELGDWVLNHLPRSLVHESDARFLSLRPKDDGRWLIHGHVHTAWKQKDKQLNVGVDVWGFAPVHLHELNRLRTQTD